MATHERKEGESFSEWLLVELNQAYLEARRGRRGDVEVHEFEVNEIENLINLRDAILSRSYKPGRGVAFVIRKPVLREIFAAPFRDKIVHHFLVNVSREWWDRRMLADAYACRFQKGSKIGILRAEKNMRRVSRNFREEAFVIKLDLQGYFLSIPRTKVLEKMIWGLDRQFPEKEELYRTMKFLWEETLLDEPAKNVTRKGSPRDWRELPRSKSLFNQPKGKGIVIGNLSSQFVANIYLDSLDRFVTGELGYKYYGRYVDDFYIMIPERRYEKAKADVVEIEKFLDGMELKLHPTKRYYQNIKNGFEFLGVVIYPGRVVPGKRVKAGFREAVRDFSSGRGKEEAIVSYLGFMKNINGRKATEKIFREVGWDFDF